LGILAFKPFLIIELRESKPRKFFITKGLDLKFLITKELWAAKSGLNGKNPGWVAGVF